MARDEALEKQVLAAGFEDFRRFVNPLIFNRASLASEPWRIVGTKDGRVVDADGQVYEDFHGTQAFGHRRQEITDAVKAYLDSDIPTWWPARVSPYAGQLARRLHERTGYDNCFFGMSGSDAVEAAIKLGRALTGRPGIICIEGAYHGCNMGSTALMNEGLFSNAFGPHLPGVVRVPFGDVDALCRAFDEHAIGSLILEPIQGEGGVRRLPDDFVAAACELSERQGALLVADEVQTGLGRTGRGFLYSHQTWPRRPDAVIIAKALGGGLIPLSSMMTSREIFERAYGAHFAAGESHNITFGFNSVGAAAGLATLDLLTDDLIERVAKTGARFKALLQDKLLDSPLVEEIRGEGLMLGIVLTAPKHPWLTFEHFGFPDLGHQSPMAPLLCHRLYRRGFFCFSCGHDWGILRLQPRLEIDDATLTRFVQVCREEVNHLCELSS